jgi:hypothetical protein
MTMLVLADAKELTGEQYLGASKRAVDIGDVEKVRLFYEQAERIADLPKSYYGDVISHAYGENNHIAKVLLKQATLEQIGGASPHLLQQVAFRDDYSTASELVRKGIHTNEVAADVIRAFQRSPWAITHLMEQGMEIEPHNYGASTPVSMPAIRKRQKCFWIAHGLRSLRRVEPESPHRKQRGF